MSEIGKVGLINEPYHEYIGCEKVPALTEPEKKIYDAAFSFLSHASANTRLNDHNAAIAFVDLVKAVKPYFGIGGVITIDKGLTFKRWYQR